MVRSFIERFSIPWHLTEAPGDNAADRTCRKLESSLLTYLDKKRRREREVEASEEEGGEEEEEGEEKGEG